MKIQSGDDIEKNKKSQEIRNRESWLKVLVIALFSIIIAWKIVTTPLDINMADFRFTDLLTLIVAIFAIVLSMAFYFKATDTSNIFYDNTYKFTQDVSEILGRIEAGFGERLRHLDEGYSGLMNKFDRLPIDINKVEKEAKHEEEEVKKIEKERDQLLETLVEKAKLANHEKTELFKNLKEKDEELNQAKNEFEFLKRKLENEATRAEYRQVPPIHYSTRKYLIQLAERLDVINAHPDKIMERYSRMEDNIPNNIFNNMLETGIIDREGNLTRRGVQVLDLEARILKG